MTATAQAARAVCPECEKTMTVRPMRREGGRTCFPIHHSRGVRCPGSRWVVEADDLTDAIPSTAHQAA